MKHVKLSGVRPSEEAPHTEEVSGPVRKLQLGTALSRAIGALFGNFFSFSAIGCLVYAPIVACAIAFTGNVTVLKGDTSQVGWMGVLLSFLATAIFTQIAYVAILSGGISFLSGDKMTLGRMIRSGMKFLFPVIAVAIISFVLVLLGYVFLIIPGVIISLMLYVAIPAVIAEKKDPIEALKRSRDLTRGSRWAIFAVMIIVAIITNVPQWLVGFIQPSAENVPLLFVVTVLSYGVITAVNGALNAAVYVQLRECKEGISTDEVTEVFA
ncbi:hypothetical protein [Kordiimonas marina]|uniref:hypothetical protein n=1 Tax=Kordiimonas marina TaxID=2872312 RepID=UPI001FF30381|nr:hypothetical protein [Kordiimonas marina]MCJ9427537.1 hypothetical protein [Kordiimonas marina]